MNLNYLEKTVFLDTETDELFNATTSISINKQASRCLAFLISKTGNIVSKEELIEECWLKHGMFVSEVTVRQTFFNLRKALSLFNFPADSLITVRGKGYVLETGAICLADKKGMVFGTEIIQPNQEDTFLNHDKAPALPVKRINKIYLYCILIFVSTVTIRHLMMIHKVTYSDIGRYEGINFLAQKYVSNNISLELIYSRLKVIVDTGSITKDSISYVYINQSLIQNISIFACSKPIQDVNANCFSVIIIGDEK